MNSHRQPRSEMELHLSVKKRTKANGAGAVGSACRVTPTEWRPLSDKDTTMHIGQQCAAIESPHLAMIWVGIPVCDSVCPPNCAKRQLVSDFWNCHTMRVAIPCATCTSHCCVHWRFFLFRYQADHCAYTGNACGCRWWRGSTYSGMCVGLFVSAAIAGVMY